jgi:DNA-binding NarL/FixJ family response regulator
LGSKILIVDDHPLFRQALVIAASNAISDVEIIEAGNLDGALKALELNKDFALILLDLKIPGANGYSGVALIHAEVPSTPILVVSSAEPEKAAAEAKRFGAIGFISKDNDLGAIENAIGAAINNDIAALAKQPNIAIDAEVDDMAQKVASLTPMQLRVLLGVLSGRLNKQIAYDLGISEATVKAHLTAIFKKLDVGNRTQAALAARALGIGN